MLPARDSASVSFVVFPRDLGWVLEDSIASGFTGAGFALTASPAASYAVEFGIDDMHVLYSDIHKQGFFGSKVLERQVALTLRAKAVQRHDGAILFAQALRDSTTDTIALSDVERVENASMPVTRGTVPAEGFFSTFAEPLVTLGAVALAVFLLFSVRS